MKKLFFSILILLIGFTAFAQQKFALVIGNSNYTGISRLNNPVNDANDMETVLRNLGFTVDKVLDGTLEQMENAVLNLKRRLGASRNSYGFFFFAGHGVQASGENYLVPIAANNIRSETHLRERAVSLQFILDSLSEAGNELNMVVLDACRDNPFSWARSGSRGLSVVSRAPTGTIVMYAAGAGQQASDGSGRNGLFTSHLLTNLRTPGLSVFQVFDRTMGAVINATNGIQHPELSLRFAGAAEAYLGTRQSPSPTPSPTPTQIPADFVRINGGTFTMGSPANEPGRHNDEIQRQVTVSSFHMGIYLVTQREYREVMGTNPSNFRGDNLPVETVSWFDAIEYCNRRSQREGFTPAYTISGSGNNRTVTWNRNANGYRLPTEAEWEYACRAGTTTPWNTGASITTSQANFGYLEENSRATTVDRYLPNRWGLYDMHGNVWEWCWDWFGTYASGVQTNPTGAISGTHRVVRGGSMLNDDSSLRSAFRHTVSPAERDYFIGFRVVRNAQ